MTLGYKSRSSIIPDCNIKDEDFVVAVSDTTDTSKKVTMSFLGIVWCFIQISLWLNREWEFFIHWTCEEGHLGSPSEAKAKGKVCVWVCSMYMQEHVWVCECVCTCVCMTVCIMCVCVWMYAYMCVFMYVYMYVKLCYLLFNNSGLYMGQFCLPSWCWQSQRDVLGVKTS